MTAEVWVSWLAQDFIATIVSKSSRVFEWGSGGSTLWFAEHAKSVTSIEHNPDWGQRVSDRLTEISNCELRICSNLEQYVEEISGGLYDFIMVDGVSHVRYDCARMAVDHLEIGGWLAVDNTERPFAEPIHRMLRSWDNVTIRGNGPKHESGHYKIQTTFWKKPSGDKHDAH